MLRTALVEQALAVVEEKYVVNGAAEVELRAMRVRETSFEEMENIFIDFCF